MFTRAAASRWVAVGLGSGTGALSFEFAMVPILGLTLGVL